MQSGELHNEVITRNTDIQKEKCPSEAETDNL